MKATIPAGTFNGSSFHCAGCPKNSLARKSTIFYRVVKVLWLSFIMQRSVYNCSGLLIVIGAVVALLVGAMPEEGSAMMIEESKKKPRSATEMSKVNAVKRAVL